MEQLFFVQYLQQKMYQQNRGINSANSISGTWFYMILVLRF